MTSSALHHLLGEWLGGSGVRPSHDVDASLGFLTATTTSPQLRLASNTANNCNTTSALTSFLTSPTSDIIIPTAPTSNMSNIPPHRSLNPHSATLSLTKCPTSFIENGNLNTPDRAPPKIVVKPGFPEELAGPRAPGDVMEGWFVQENAPTQRPPPPPPIEDNLRHLFTNPEDVSSVQSTIMMPPERGNAGSKYIEAIRHQAFVLTVGGLSAGLFFGSLGLHNLVYRLRVRELAERGLKISKKDGEIIRLSDDEGESDDEDIEVVDPPSRGGFFARVFGYGNDRREGIESDMDEEDEEDRGDEEGKDGEDGNKLSEGKHEGGRRNRGSSISRRMMDTLYEDGIHAVGSSFEEGDRKRVPKNARRGGMLQQEEGEMEEGEEEE